MRIFQRAPPRASLAAQAPVRAGKHPFFPGRVGHLRESNGRAAVEGTETHQGARAGARKGGPSAGPLARGSDHRIASRPPRGQILQKPCLSEPADMMVHGAATQARAGGEFADSGP